MGDLSHWNFTSSFRPKEAAALILGIDPSLPDVDLSRTAPVISGMAQWYLPVRFHPYALPVADRPHNLYSVQLLRGIERGDAEKLAKLDESHFDDQYFTESELARWLKVHDFPSVYQFDKALRDVIPEVVQRGTHWPWGSHRTRLLECLEQAALRFWVNYDPSDATTAPINATVSEWLKKEFGLSGAMADAIASILRPDGLPTGPRK
jgi:hypothetical protein